MKKLLLLIGIFTSFSSIFIATPDINKDVCYSMKLKKENDSQLPLEMQSNRLLNNELAVDISQFIFEANVLHVSLFITIMSEISLIQQMNSPITPAVIGTGMLIGGSMLGGILSAYNISGNKNSLDVDKETMNLLEPSMILPVMSSLILSGDQIVRATENKIVGLGGIVGLTIGSLLIGDIIGSRLYRYRNK